MLLSKEHSLVSYQLKKNMTYKYDSLIEFSKPKSYVSYNINKVFYEFSKLPNFCTPKSRNIQTPVLQCKSEDLDDLKLIGKDPDPSYLRL